MVNLPPAGLGSSYSPTTAGTTGTANAGSSSRPAAVRPDHVRGSASESTHTRRRDRIANAFPAVRKMLRALKGKETHPEPGAKQAIPASQAAAHAAGRHSQDKAAEASSSDDTKAVDETVGGDGSDSSTVGQQALSQRPAATSPIENLPPELIATIGDFLTDELDKLALDLALYPDRAVELVSQMSEDLDRFPEIRDPESRVSKFEFIAQQAGRCLRLDGHTFKVVMKLATQIQSLPVYRDHQMRGFEQIAALVQHMADPLLRATALENLARRFGTIELPEDDGAYATPKRGNALVRLAGMIDRLPASAARQEAVRALAVETGKLEMRTDLVVAFPPVATLVGTMDDTVDKGNAIAALANQLCALPSPLYADPPYSYENASRLLRRLADTLTEPEARAVAMKAIDAAMARPRPLY